MRKRKASSTLYSINSLQVVPLWSLLTSFFCLFCFLPASFLIFKIYLFGCAGSQLQHETFSCGMWDLGPWSRIRLGPPAMGTWSLHHWTTKEAHRQLLTLQYFPTIFPSLPSQWLLSVWEHKHYFLPFLLILNKYLWFFCFLSTHFKC